MPPSSATMVGRAGATRVRLSEAMSDPSISPANTARTARSTPFFAGAVSADLVATAVNWGSLLAASWQTQHALGEDVPQDFRGSCLDRVRSRAEELVLPAAGLANLTGRPGHVDGGLGHSLVELRPHQFQNRALRPRNSISLHGGQC